MQVAKCAASVGNTRKCDCKFGFNTSSTVELLIRSRKGANLDCAY